MTDSKDEIDLATRLALRPREAAAALGVSERTLRQLLPELPVVRRGGVVLVPVEGLRTWLSNQADIEGRRCDAIASEILDAMKANSE